ncbi:hypothetical protein [Xenorhabdus cabanillasii]|uniref:hypothetical protein n=1 Tax=Xenorhabdus cabanillasii TaxID=351673 RepID=UPI001E65B49C|nr:hypothetical protein [Xenorhabdus cabanillasii]
MQKLIQICWSIIESKISEFGELYVLIDSQQKLNCSADYFSSDPDRAISLPFWFIWLTVRVSSQMNMVAADLSQKQAVINIF